VQRSRSAGAALQGVNAGAGVPGRPAGLPAQQDLRAAAGHLRPALAHRWRGCWPAAEASTGVYLFRGASTPGHPVTAVRPGVEAEEADTRLLATARHTQRHTGRLEHEQIRCDK